VSPTGNPGTKTGYPRYFVMPRRTTRRRPTARMARAPLARRVPRRRRRILRKTRINRGVVIRPIGGVAERVITRHKYFAIGSQTAAGLLSNFMYFANSMYDPEYAVGGHQPIGFDQMTALYRNYSVLKSTFVVRCFPQSGSVTQSKPTSVILSMLPPWKTGATPIFPVTGTYSALMERSGTKHTTLMSGDKTYRLKYTWSSRQDFDWTNKESNTVVSEVAGGNDYPPINTGYCLTFTSADGLTSGDVSFEVMIYYTVLWTQPRNLAGS